MLEELRQRIAARLVPSEGIEGKTIAKLAKTDGAIGIMFTDGSVVAFKSGIGEDEGMLSQINVWPLDREGFAIYPQWKILKRLGIITEDDQVLFESAKTAWLKSQREATERAEYLRLKAKYEAQQ